MALNSKPFLPQNESIKGTRKSTPPINLTDNVSLDQAGDCIKKSMKRAQDIGVNVSIFVVDSAGTPVAFSRMDGAGIMTPDIARAKAFTAIAFKRNTKDMAENLKDRPSAAAGIMGVGGGRILILAGGVVIRGGGGTAASAGIIGAVGVSGATSDQDHECATAGAGGN